MAYNARTLSQIEHDAVASARERIPQGNWSTGTDNRQRLAHTATVAWHVQAEAGRVERDILPDTASEAGLQRWGRILSTPRNGATVASREAALRVRGTFGSTVTAGTTLTHAVTGSQFQVAENVVIPTSLFVDADLVSVTTGAIARLDEGEVLTFDSAPVGIEAEAELVLDLLGGLDEEPLEDWRQRIIRRFRESDALVTATDWQAAAEEQNTVDDAYVYPLRGGLGTVDVAVLRAGRGATRVLSSADLDDVRAYLEARRSVAMRDWRLLNVITREIDVEVTITARPGVTAWDWGDASSVPVSAYNSGTRTLTLNPRPATMVRGSRLVIKDAAGNVDGSVSAVLDTPGLNDVVIDRDYGYTFGVGDVVYAAGELTEPTRAAILAYFDALGTALGDYGGAWEDSFRLGLVEAAIFTAVPGVRDLTWISPTADELAMEPPSGYSDDYIELLIPDRVLVRREP